MAGGIAGVVAESETGRSDAGDSGLVGGTASPARPVGSVERRADPSAADPAPSDDPLSFIAFGASCRA
jgi:hypothetical protein